MEIQTTFSSASNIDVDIEAYTVSNYLEAVVLQELNKLKSQPIIGIAVEPFLVGAKRTEEVSNDSNSKNMFICYGLLCDPDNPSKYAKLPIRFKLEFTIVNGYFSEIFTKITFETELRFVPGSKFLELTSTNFNYAYMRPMLLDLKLHFRKEILRNPKDFKAMKKSAFEFSCPVTGHLGSDENTWFPSLKKVRPSYVIPKLPELPLPQEVLGYEIHLNEEDFSFKSESFVKMTDHEFQHQFEYKTQDIKHFWLPLPIHQLKDDNRNFKTLLATIKEIKYTYSSVFTAETPNYTVLFKICSSLMNSIVIKLLHRVESVVKLNLLVRAYYTIHNFLQEYCEYEPILVELAETTLKKFINGSDDSRCPANIPNLGEFLMYLTISKKYKWEDIATKYQFETDIRNVYKYPKHIKRVDFDKHRRCNQVFVVTKYSRFLTLVHVLLLKASSSSSQEIASQIESLFEWLNSIKTWEDYFTALNVPNLAINRKEQLIQTLLIAKLRLFKRFATYSKPPLQDSDGFDDLLASLFLSWEQQRSDIEIIIGHSKINPRFRR